MTSSPSPREQLIISTRNNDIESLRNAINLLRKSKRGFDLAEALSIAVREASLPAVTCLLEQEKAPVTDLEPSKVVAAFTRNEKEGRDQSSETNALAIWRVLMDHGWDVNRRESGDDQHTNGDRLLTLICHNDHLINWLLCHGASAPDPPDLDPFRTPPILERVASVGSVSTFQMLYERGAQLTRRVLHRAVESAVCAREEFFDARMILVRYLVEGADCGVNAMDVEEARRLPNYWGTPLAYAAHAVQSGSGQGSLVDVVVEYLLEKGADPTIKDCWGNMSPLDRAERAGSGKLLELLRGEKRVRESG